MAFDTPARIAIVGGGPIGLEAALYARFLGYDVDIYERGFVASNVRRWRHAQLFTPFRLSSSPLGVAAIRAQDPEWTPPAADEVLTTADWLTRYLLPLAETDLLASSLLEQREVVAVGHEELHRRDEPQGEVRGDYDFQLLVRDTAGQESWASADIVIDASGLFTLPGNLGLGGMPAAGEAAARRRIEYHLPDVLGDQRPLYAGQRVLVMGADVATAHTLAALEQLVQAEPQTQITWLAPPDFHPDSEAGSAATPSASTRLIPTVANDPFPARTGLIAQANSWAASPPSWLTVLPRLPVRAIQWSSIEGAFEVTLAASEGQDVITWRGHRIVASSGFRPDRSFVRELPVAWDPIWEAPPKLGTALTSGNFDEVLGPAAHDSSLLLTAEPNFYVLGAKSYGRHPGFLYSAGLQQIRALFSIIGERSDLDLYATAARIESAAKSDS